MRMTEEFQILNFPLDAIIRIPTQLCPINKLEGNLLPSLHMLGHYTHMLADNTPVAHLQKTGQAEIGRYIALSQRNLLRVF